MNRETARVMKRLSKVLQVPINDVPTVIKNLKNEIAVMDLELTTLKG